MDEHKYCKCDRCRERAILNMAEKLFIQRATNGEGWQEEAVLCRNGANIFYDLVWPVKKPEAE